MTTKLAGYRVYSFIIADADASREWPERRRQVRREFLSDGRRMSFKNMNDRQRRQALIPFLEAAEYLEGHVVSVVVTKDLGRLSTGTDSMAVWQRLYGLQARWDVKAFEQMVRVAHFFSLFLSAWSAKGMDVSWITDDDQIVANADRLEDAHQFAARMTWLYVPHQLGEFMMNTVAVDGEERGIEDLLAIPDLAAGMLAEVVGAPSADPAHPKRRLFKDEGLSIKSEIISDWFWHCGGCLKKTCILIDRAGQGGFGLAELRREQTPPHKGVAPDDRSPSAPARR